MAGFFDIKVTRKLIFIFAVLSILLVGISIASLLYLNHTINRMSDSLYEDVFENAELILSADRDLYQAAIALHSSMSSTLTEAERDQFIQDFQDNNQQAQERVSLASSDIKSINNPYNGIKQANRILTELENELHAFETSLDLWKSTGNTLVAERIQIGWDPASYHAVNLNMQLNEVRTHLDQSEDLIDTYALQVTDGFQDKKVRSLRYTRWSFLYCSWLLFIWVAKSFGSRMKCWRNKHSIS